ncbi:MAG TPA: aldose 1-epimerase [Solirubrobacteraceae bacterium]|jgi:galactose mutarotase-like enzyme
MEIEHEGHPAHRLVAGDLAAVWVPSVGMVGASLTQRGEELLALRAGLGACAERAKTFGIPLLHPWANRIGGDAYTVDGTTVDLTAAPAMRRDPDHGVPIHGLTAASPDWRVEDASDTTLAATLDYGANEDLLAGFPFPHTLTVRVRLEPTALTVDTTLTPTGDVAVPIAFGWHPYFVIPGVPRAQWEIELPARRALLVDERQIPTGETRAVDADAGPLGDRAFDDGYDELASPVFAVAGGGRRIEVEFGAEYPVAQVFAPLAHDLIAIEPMTAPADALRSHAGLRFAAPGEPFSARFSVRPA